MIGSHHQMALYYSVFTQGSASSHAGSATVTRLILRNQMLKSWGNHSGLVWIYLFTLL